MLRTSRWRLWRIAAISVATLVIAATSVSAQTSASRDRLDRVLRVRAHQQLAGRSRVIVQFKSGADVRVFGNGAIGRRVNDRTQVGEVENRVLATLAADPRVERVTVDRPAFATMERTGAAVGATWVQEQYGYTGRGVGVAVIDSGIAASHVDLSEPAQRIVGFQDFTRDDNPKQRYADGPTDGYGHGTHVAGIIAGSGAASSGRRTGVAPEANLLGLKVLDDEGHGYISDVIAAIEYAIATRATYNTRVINISVAAGVFESYNDDPLTRAARRAVDAGIVVVASAGNLGQDGDGATQYGGITAPGNAPWVLTVGASSHQGTARRSDDIIAQFSSRGPTWIDFAAKPDVVAPGVGIESLAAPHSTLYRSMREYLLNGTGSNGFREYVSMSGSSMSAPVVTGAVALMLEANPRLTPNAVKAILQYTAQAHPEEHLLAQGAGLLNTAGAVRLARFFAAPQLGLGVMADAIEGESISWARHILWGNHVISGGTPLPGSSAWAAGLEWGALQTRTGRPVVWGARDDQNIVWSTGRDGDSNIVWSTGRDDDGNIVWSTRDDDGNIVWSTRDDDSNIVWSTGRDGDDNIVWSTRDDDGNIVWSTRGDDSNIVWSTGRGGDDNIVWSTGRDADGNIVWSTRGDDSNIVWSTRDAEGNIVWSTRDDDGNIVWSTRGDDSNIVWSTRDADGNIVWSTRGEDSNIVWSTATVQQVVWPAGRR